MMVRIPERPGKLSDLDLMKRLRAYSEGAATWHSDGQSLGPHECTVCQELHANLTTLVERCLHPLMDRVTSREMQAFTMHDSGHGLKVSHLMWHIAKPSRRELLSPGEIALLVVAAHLHDLGMGLSQSEREARLQPDSDLWDSIDPRSSYSQTLASLAEIAKSDNSLEAVQAEAVYQVQQAQEALLCADSRERHATPERYREILQSLQVMHDDDPLNIPDIETLLGFDGNSFKEKLIDICVSHNQDAYVLLDRDPTNPDQSRFPTRYPIGCCLADTRFVAATLRLADILDFDRERTPAVLFHYLLPRSADPFENISVREWAKHLSISNWEIENEKIEFRGRSPNALIHHTIVEFCKTIENEIAGTHSVFGREDWPFCVQPQVTASIETTGYRYIPYRFSLDEERVYELLMGPNIYPNSLDALRELIQNAIDACKLRDALLVCHDKSVVPSKERRIIIRYEEPGVRYKSAVLSVSDTGIGMDQYVIDNYLLKVGRSYYKSNHFLRTRSMLRKYNVDFNPVSEFGIGFMAVFMLGDRVEIETSPAFPRQNDAQRRRLRIDGLGRLIEVTETENSGVARFYGTRVSVQLDEGTGRRVPPAWSEIELYLRHVCRNLNYSLYLEHVTSQGTTESEILPEGLRVSIPEHLVNAALTIAVDDPENGLTGQIVIYRAPEARAAEAALANVTPLRPEELHYSSAGGGPPTDLRTRRTTGVLLRGGFAVGSVPGLPEFFLSPEPDARIEVSKDRDYPRSLPLTDIARSRFVRSDAIAASVFRTWLSALLDSLEEIEARPVGSPEIEKRLLRRAEWLEKYDAYTLYRLARICWLDGSDKVENFKPLVDQWEAGTGDEIWIGGNYPASLYTEIFELILPRITKLVVGRRCTYYARPPRKGWKDELHNWKSFVHDNLSWGHFAHFARELGNVLCEVYPGSRFFNILYQDKLSTLSREDVTTLIDIFDKLIDAKRFERQRSFSPAELSLLDQTLAVAGEFYIRRHETQYQLSKLIKRRL